MIIFKVFDKYLDLDHRETNENNYDTYLEKLNPIENLVIWLS